MTSPEVSIALATAELKEKRIALLAAGYAIAQECVIPASGVQDSVVLREADLQERA